MVASKAAARTLLILSLILLPGILSLNTVNVYGKNFTTTSITVSPSTLNVGGTTTVFASLFGATNTAGGTVTYHIFSTGSCSGGISQFDTKPVVNAIVTASMAFPMNSAGTFGVNAVYSGDGANNGSTSLCKQVVVTKTSTTIATTSTPAIPATITVGAFIFDSAVLTTIAPGTAVGTVVYSLFLGSTCSGTVQQTSMKTVAAGIVPDSNHFTINTIGTYSLRAAYSGDSKNLGSTSPCETPVTVTKQSPTITTASPFIPASIMVGSSIFDTATLMFVTSTAGGSVTYNLFGNAVCGGTPIQTSSVTVTNHLVPNSKNFIINAVGLYSLNAVYSGDPNNIGPVTSSCEATLTVTQKSPTISASFVPPTTILAGQSITVSASLSGATFSAGGTVQYDLYTDIGCTLFFAASTVTVTFGAVPNSHFVINSIGTYYVKAVYSGDINNAGATSLCVGTVTVNMATPSVSTQVSAQTIFVDGTVSDQATLIGATSNAGGTIAYSLFSDGTCTAFMAGHGPFAVINGNVPNSGPFTPPSGPTGSFKAFYVGDANNAGATGTCETFNVVLHSPSISTQLSAQSISFGGKISDSATLTNAGATAGGTVTYSLYSNSACTGSVVPGQHDTETVTNRVVPSTSTPLTPNNPGTFGIQAVYTGDAANNGATSNCEAFTVLSISISTQLSATQIFSDAKITDSATLSGVTAAAGGTVTYNLYPNGACTGFIVPGQTDTEPVTNGVVPPTSTPLTPNGLGSFSIQATYSGDANNGGATSPCEVFTVVLHSPSLSTQLSATAITPSGSVTDSATLTGASATAGGTVTFTMYSGSLCLGGPVQSATKTVTNGVVPTTGLFTPGVAGLFSFQAVYTGDGNNNPATSPCNEILTVALFSPTISTHLSASTIVVFGLVTDSATLTGATSTAGGSVTFTMYSGGSCSGGMVDSATETVTDGIVPTTGNFGPGDTSSVGFFSFRAVYTGDGDNNPATSPCEILTVNPASPTISTILSSNTIVNGGSVTDSSALFGATSTAGGTVTIKMYTGGTCEVGGTYTGQSATLTVTNAIVPTTGAFTPAGPGTFSFRAVYSGDVNNMAATAPCEVLTVT